MIGKDREAEILRLYHAEQWPIGTIARLMGVHHGVVRRVLRRSGALISKASRPTKVDAYLPFLLEQLERWPTLPASRLHAMVRARGYDGGPDHFRVIVARHRPKPKAEAYLRLRTLAGEEGQVDWADFGKFTVGSAKRPLVAFVMVLSWSRHLFLQFYPSMTMPWFLRGHVEAVTQFGGTPRRLLYDNLKSAVSERAGDVIRFHPNLLALAGHYRFEPRPVAPARGNEKGRVERAIRFVRDSFFAARTWTDLADLNAQARAWAHGEAADRRAPEDRTRTVRAMFDEEREHLLPLPDDHFPADERVDVEVGKTPYVRFDLNDYSVPADCVRRTLTVSASPDRVRVLDVDRVVADHHRSWDRGQQIEDRSHIERLVEDKRRAREHRGLDQIHHALPHGPALLQAIAQQGGNVGTNTVRLMRLLTMHAAADIDAAIVEVMAGGRAHLGAVEQAIDRARTARGQPPAVAIPLPRRAQTGSVKPHDLATYDRLRTEDSNHD